MAGYTATIDGVTCTACGAGSYKNVTGAVPCSMCATGTYTNTSGSVGAVECINCPANSYCSGGIRFECDVHKISPAGGGDASLCKCMNGYFS